MNAITPINSETRHKVGLRAADFLMLAEAGAFDSYARTELIEGEIWAVNAIHSWHAATMLEIGRRLANSLDDLGSPLRVYAAGSVGVSDDSVPEPDISIGDVNEDGILPLDKLRLAIEVSDATATFDLGRKLALYARAGVPEYWVVERDTRTVHIFWSPEGEGYAERRQVPFGARVEAVTIKGVVAETGRL